MKKFVVISERAVVKAMFDTREAAREWVFKNDKWGEYIVYPMIVDENGNMEMGEW